MAGIGDFGEPRAGDTGGHGAADFGRGQAVMLAENQLRRYGHRFQGEGLIVFGRGFNRLDVAVLVQALHAGHQALVMGFRRVRADQGLGDHRGDVLGFLAAFFQGFQAQFDKALAFRLAQPLEAGEGGDQ